MQKDVQLTVVGKIFKPNAQKVLALNRSLIEYHRLVVNGREIRCPSCGLIYNRDLNGAINIAQLLKRELGWGSVIPPNSLVRLNAESFN